MTADPKVAPESVPEFPDDDYPEPEHGKGARITDAWRSRLIIGEDKNGLETVKPIAANVSTILRFHPSWRGVVAYDAFRESVVSLKEPPWHIVDKPDKVITGEWSDDDTGRLVNWLAREEALFVSPLVADAGLMVVARTDEVHPVREYLRRVVWDGTPRLDGMLTTYFGTADGLYERGTGSRWMISLVARIMNPGCQSDCTLVLEGEQGSGKTSAFRSLMHDPSWYADSGLDLSNKDSFEALRSVWLYGLDELDSLRRGDLTRWKNFLSATRDHYRPPYARRARDFPRQCGFCGTTNESQYLTDRTGNRRFLPVRVMRAIDRTLIVRDRDQLWAEAVVRFDAGEEWHVNTPGFRLLCETQQLERVQEDPWESIVAEWLKEPKVKEASGQSGFPEVSTYDDAEGVLTSDILTHALNVPKRDMTNAMTQRIAGILKSLGYEKGPQRREGGERVRRYVAPSEGVTRVPGDSGDPGDTPR